MRSKIIVGAAGAFAALFLGGVPAGASTATPPPFQCNTTVNGGSFVNVAVPAGGVCVLNGVNVSGNVTAGANAYFESNGSTVAGNVLGNQALTLYVWNHSTVGGDVAGYQAPQMFLYDSTFKQNVGGASSVAPGYGHFQLCGSTIGHDVAAYQMGPDVLIGAPAAGCGANSIGGNLYATSNTADSELYVIGNSVTRGDLNVTNNTGAGDKRVNGNTVSGDLVCSGNSTPFDGSKNVAAHGVSGGQCSLGS